MKTIDNKVKDYLERARKIQGEARGGVLSGIKYSNDEIEIAKMLQLQEQGKIIDHEKG